MDAIFSAASLAHRARSPPATKIASTLSQQQRYAILQQKARGVIMLGEQIGEETGKVIVRRVVAGEGRPKVEVSVQSNGKLLGVETRGIVTYTATVRADGSVYGEGQGIVVGKNGEAATMRVGGAGRLSSDAVTYRGRPTSSRSRRSGSASIRLRSCTSTKRTPMEMRGPSHGSGSSSAHE
jgi:hypothetical protein